jgi:hypothetical protein
MAVWGCMRLYRRLAGQFGKQVPKGARPGMEVRRVEELSLLFHIWRGKCEDEELFSWTVWPVCALLTVRTNQNIKQNKTFILLIKLFFTWLQDFGFPLFLLLKWQRELSFCTSLHDRILNQLHSLFCTPIVRLLYFLFLGFEDEYYPRDFCHQTFALLVSAASS